MGVHNNGQIPIGMDMKNGEEMQQPSQEHQEKNHRHGRISSLRNFLPSSYTSSLSASPPGTTCTIRSRRPTCDSMNSVINPSRPKFFARLSRQTRLLQPHHLRLNYVVPVFCVFTCLFILLNQEPPSPVIVPVNPDPPKEIDWLMRGKIPPYVPKSSAARQAFHEFHRRDGYRFDPPRGFILHEDEPLVRDGTGWDVSPIVLEEFQLVFFTVPKVGTTVFKQLFRRMMGIQNWTSTDGELPHNPKSNGLKYLYDYTLATANEMLTSPNWTRAIFVRDPESRVLSAYLDKVLHDHGEYIMRHCCPFHSKMIQTPDSKFEAKSFQSLRDHIRKNELRMAQDQTGVYFKGIRDGGRLPSRRLLQKEAEEARDRILAQEYESLLHLPTAEKVEGVNRMVSEYNLAPGILSQSHKYLSRRGRTHVPYCKHFASWNSTVDNVTISFETFVDHFMPFCDDAHWRPQSRRLPRLVWPYINFVGYFDTLQQDTKQLLQRVDAWERFGAWGWGSTNTSVFATNDAAHKTSASSRARTHYTPALEAKVRQYYFTDYRHPIINFTGHASEKAVIIGIETG